MIRRQSRGESEKFAFTLVKNSSQIGKRSGRAVQQDVADMMKPSRAISAGVNLGDPAGRLILPDCFQKHPSISVQTSVAIAIVAGISWRRAG